MKHNNYEKEIRNILQYLKLPYLSSLSGNIRCTIYLAASSLSTKISTNLAKSFEKLKTTTASTLMDFRSWAIKLPKSHVHRTGFIIMLSVLIRSFQLLQTLEKKHHLSDFCFDCLSTFSKTTWLE